MFLWYQNNFTWVRFPQNWNAHFLYSGRDWVPRASADIARDIQLVHLHFCILQKECGKLEGTGLAMYYFSFMNFICQINWTTKVLLLFSYFLNSFHSIGGQKWCHIFFLISILDHSQVKLLFNLLWTENYFMQNLYNFFL